MLRPMVQSQGRSDYAEQVALSVLRHDAERGIIVSSRGGGRLGCRQPRAGSSRRAVQ